MIVLHHVQLPRDSLIRPPIFCSIILPYIDDNRRSLFCSQRARKFVLWIIQAILNISLKWFEHLYSLRTACVNVPNFRPVLRFVIAIFSCIPPISCSEGDIFSNAIGWKMITFITYYFELLYYNWIHHVNFLKVVPVILSATVQPTLCIFKSKKSVL